MSFLADFKKFALKGNVVDLAVGVVIGTAFGKIVSGLVADLVMPFVSLLLPGGEWRSAGIVLRKAADPKDDVVLKYGNFLGHVLDFMIVALVLFVLVTYIVKVAEGRLSKPAPPPPPARECPFCREAVHLEATRCKSCTSALPEGA
jgi:large conductance mechanosensitive channel